MTLWLEPLTLPIPAELRAAIDGHPILLQSLVQRGLTASQAAQAFLDPHAYTPTAPQELPGVEAVIQRLLDALRMGEAIGVWGDFDVDGQTATALLVSALRRLGAKVFYHIPIRDQEGHGVNVPNLEHLVREGTRLVLTCDTGITAQAAAQAALEWGVDFLVTDHHELPPALPPAKAIVNPKFLPAAHPLSSLPGVGVAYKVIEALYCSMGREEELEEFLDLVALGIIADVATLKGDTRYLAQLGIERLRQNTRLGLRLLLENAEMSAADLTEEQISFGLAPRLNAVGRLADANPMVEFLTTQDESLARQMAFEIEGYNEMRKRLTEDVFQAALHQLEQNRALLEHAVLVLYHPQWHPGVVGIVASRLVERFGKPAILLCGEGESGARGSARSVEGVNITQAIAAQAALLSSFGGHPMAAGLAFAPAADLAERIARFRQAINYTVEEMLGGRTLETQLQLSAYLPLDQVDWLLAEQLERLAPFGAGNPAPLFAAQNLTLSSYSEVGRQNEHLIMDVEDEQGKGYRLIWWQGAGWPLPEGKFDLAYRLRGRSYNGERHLQLEWVDFRLCPQATLALTTAEALILEDYRQDDNPHQRLQALRAEGDLLLWAEAAERAALQGKDRNELDSHPHLVIWTIPPSASELRRALQRVRPQRITFFAIDPQTDTLDRFLERLRGLLKVVAIRQHGQTTWAWLAAATCHRVAAVRLGVQVLAEQGLIEILAADDQGFTFQPCLAKPSASPTTNLLVELLRQLEESRAFRRYYATCSLETLRSFLNWQDQST
ncbi:MAG: single-stranded-DNA-specific exonuclease RecJ [Anaerolineae bacterium]|jgi:single-stranded-DNA-specific exonuclease|nr:MAG: single-stranded-DNA-specific exonuclease RecJ [Anaerolineae bacterium]